jgi:hypothetical protein
MLGVHLDEDRLEDLGKEVTISLKSVALQSYTRSAGAENAGYEFVHKTLGEYLIACGLVRAVIRASEHLRERVNDGRCRSAALELSRTAHSGALTSEIHRFFQDEIRLRFSDYRTSRATIQDRVVPLLNWIVRNGLPVHRALRDSDSTSFVALEHAERRAFDVVWAFSQAVANQAFPPAMFEGDRAKGGWTTAPIALSWPTSTSFTSVFSKLADRGHVTETRRLNSFDFLDLRDQALTELTFGSVIFEGSRPRNWMKFSCRAGAAPEAEFFQAHLDGADLTRADLRGVVAHAIDLNHALLEGV